MTLPGRTVTGLPVRSAVILVVLCYRLIPDTVRSLWSADGSSAKALAALRSGAPIGATLRRYAVPAFRARVWEPPSWDN
jgi:hypothetical protein